MTQIIERPPTGDFGEPRPSLLTMTLAQAVNQALHDAMSADDRVLVFGEDVARLGGLGAARAERGAGRGGGDREGRDQEREERQGAGHHGSLGIRSKCGSRSDGRSDQRLSGSSWGRVAEPGIQNRGWCRMRRARPALS